MHKIELQLQNDELRVARLAVEATLARYTHLFHFAPLGYAVLALDQTIREINHAGAALVGRDRSRLLGKRFETFVPLSHRPLVMDVLRRAQQSGTRQHADLELLDEQGGLVPVGLSAVEFPGTDPTILIGLEDIRERKTREDQLRQTELALRDLDRRKDEFLAALSHELRNPLTPLRTSLFLLQKKAAGDEEIRRVESIMDRQVAQLSRLVDDLLDVTRITRGKVRLRRERLDLAPLVRATLDDHRDALAAAHIRLEEDLEAGPFWVDGDAARLVQSISNALGNAEKYTPQGGSVTVTLRRSGGEVCVRIRDTGAGIEPHLLARVFEPFAQGPQHLDRKGGGLGLGLAVVKGFIELHGGRTTITSEGPGRGTELAIILPLDETIAPVQLRPAPPAQHHRRRVLIVDDSADTADTLAEALEAHGHAVCVAYEGRSALDVARTLRPDVVICDIGLPGAVDGYSVAETLRREGALKDTYLIALSGYGSSEDVRRAKEAGFDEHVTKPPLLKDLEGLISRARGVQIDAHGSPTIDLLH